LLPVLLGAQFMVVIDETVVNVALPSIRMDLGLDTEQLSWIVNAYLLLFGGLLLLTGRLADLVGRRRMFLAGLALFTVASLVAGTAEREQVLIGARAVQGMGGAMLSPAALSILTSSYQDPVRRRRALGAWAATLGFGATLGVILGGMIVEFLSWHWIFWVNGPVGALLCLGCLLVVPGNDSTPARRALRGLDLPGAAMVTVAGLLLVYTVVRTDTRGWTGTSTLAGLGVVLFLVICLVIWQRVARQPLLPNDVIRRRAAFAYPIAALTASALFGMFFFVTLYMQLVMRWSPLSAGLGWAPHGVTVALASGLAVVLVPRIGARNLIVFGLLLAAGAQLLLARVPGDASYRDLLPALFLNGLGIGLCLVPATAVAVTGVRGHQLGAASGLINAAQQVGGAVGLAALVSVVSGQLARHPDPMRAFQSGFRLGAFLLVLAAGLALALPRTREPVNLDALA
jgi:EmrB/QacA subfamily drug resistance transporter